MYQGFKSDIFSKSKISWTKKIDKSLYNDINKLVGNSISSADFLILQNKELGLNSNNFKLKFKSKIILLKKWSIDSKASEINSILNLMVWLNKNKLPIQMPQFFKNQKYLIRYKKNYWSFFKYIDGNHFKGNIKEFNDAVKNIGRLTNKLKSYPIKKFKKAPEYYSNSDYEILNLMNKKNFKFEKKFGKYAKSIKIYLPEIIKLFDKYKNFNFKKNREKIDHIDLHPHNIITKNNKIQALIDIDSCKVVEEGYAIAFNALKVCKQTIIYNKKKINKKNLVSKFMYILEKEYKLSDDIKNNFYYFAISEVLRRLTYMFKLTLNNNDKKWNKIIPIQLGHLDECKEFFFKKP